MSRSKVTKEKYASRTNAHQQSQYIKRRSGSLDYGVQLQFRPAVVLRPKLQVFLQNQQGRNINQVLPPPPPPPQEMSGYGFIRHSQPTQYMRYHPQQMHYQQFMHNRVQANRKNPYDEMQKLQAINNSLKDQVAQLSDKLKKQQHIIHEFEDQLNNDSVKQETKTKEQEHQKDDDQPEFQTNELNERLAAQKMILHEQADVIKVQKCEIGCLQKIVNEQEDNNSELEKKLHGKFNENKLHLEFIHNLQEKITKLVGKLQVQSDNYEGKIHQLNDALRLKQDELRLKQDQLFNCQGLSKKLLEDLKHSTSRNPQPPKHVVKKQERI